MGIFCFLINRVGYDVAFCFPEGKKAIDTGTCGLCVSGAHPFASLNMVFTPSLAVSPSVPIIPTI